MKYEDYIKLQITFTKRVIGLILGIIRKPNLTIKIICKEKPIKEGIFAFIFASILSFFLSLIFHKSILSGLATNSSPSNFPKLSFGIMILIIVIIYIAIRLLKKVLDFESLFTALVFIASTVTISEVIFISIIQFFTAQENIYKTAFYIFGLWATVLFLIALKYSKRVILMSENSIPSVTPPQIKEDDAFLNKLKKASKICQAIVISGLSFVIGFLFLLVIFKNTISYSYLASMCFVFLGVGFNIGLTTKSILLSAVPAIWSIFYVPMTLGYISKYLNDEKIELIFLTSGIIAIFIGIFAGVKVRSKSEMSRNNEVT